MQRQHLAIDIPSTKTLIAQAISNPFGMLPSVKTAKKILTFTTSVIAMLPILPYAFTAFLPADLTWQLWSNLPLHVKFTAIAFTMITLGIGTLVRYKHIPSMVNKLKDLVSGFCESLPSFLNNSFILSMSILAAIASLALGYYGMRDMSQTAAMGAAGINFLITFGFRIESMSALIQKVKNLFDQDLQFQNDLMNELKRIKPEHIASFESSLKAEMNSGNSLSEEIIAKCLAKLYDKANYIDLDETHPAQTQLEIFNPPRAIDDAKYYLQKAIELSFGSMIGGTLLAFFTQYGYDGIKLLYQIPTGSTAIEDLSYAAKVSLGLLVATSSGVLGFTSGMRIPDTAISAFDYSRISRANVFKIMMLSLGCGIAGTSFAKAGYDIAKKENLFNITTENAAGYLLVINSWLYATCFDIAAILALATKNDATHNNVVKWLDTHKLSKEMITALKQHSYFKKEKNEATPLLKNYEIDLHVLKSYSGSS